MGSVEENAIGKWHGCSSSHELVHRSHKFSPGAASHIYSPLTNFPFCPAQLHSLSVHESIPQVSRPGAVPSYFRALTQPISISPAYLAR